VGRLSGIHECTLKLYFSSSSDFELEEVVQTLSEHFKIPEANMKCEILSGNCLHFKAKGPMDMPVLAAAEWLPVLLHKIPVKKEIKYEQRD
jgi:hypothetical protein